MSLWWYRAVRMPFAVTSGREPGKQSTRRREPVVEGELSGTCPGQVRAQLRGMGLLAVAVRPANTGAAQSLVFRRPWVEWRRRVRRLSKADLLENLAGMLDAGLPVTEAIASLARASRRGARTLLQDLHEGLRNGESLSRQVREHPSWFDAADAAMVEAAEHAGELATAFKSLCARHRRCGESSQRLAALLTYPIIVLVTGLGVGVFLSTRTLPQITSILRDSDVQVPTLTVVVMSCGRFLAGWWWLTLLGAAAAYALSLARASRRAPVGARKRPLIERAARSHRISIRRAAVLGEAFAMLQEMIRAGVPLVDALRVTAPSLGSDRAMSRCLLAAAASVEEGFDLSTCLARQTWIDDETHRQLATGEAAGTLDDSFGKLAERYSRLARRRGERLARFAEPMLILGLTCFVGLIVFAAVLPLLRLREVL